VFFANIDNVHWVAVIIDTHEQNFHIIDPKGYNTSLTDYFESWIKYYNNRDDASVKWKNNSPIIKHPIQKDSYNCGVFVCLLIEEFITSQQKINFNYSKNKMLIFRKQIADKLEENAVFL
jgi:Ulp1 family protease